MSSRIFHSSLPNRVNIRPLLCETTSCPPAPTRRRTLYMVIVCIPLGSRRCLNACVGFVSAWGCQYSGTARTSANASKILVSIDSALRSDSWYTASGTRQKRYGCWEISVLGSWKPPSLLERTLWIYVAAVSSFTSCGMGIRGVSCQVSVPDIVPDSTALKVGWIRW